MEASQALSTTADGWASVSVLLHGLTEASPGSVSSLIDRLCSRGRSVNRARVDVAFNQATFLSTSVSAGATSISSRILCLALRKSENYDSTRLLANPPLAVREVHDEPRKIRTNCTTTPNDSTLRLYTQSPDLRLRLGGGAQRRQSSLCGMWGHYSRSPPPKQRSLDFFL
jgi:hypothetical protein